MHTHIYTFGYEGLSLESFIARLKLASIKAVLDVRINPISRKPGFSKKAFAAALDDAGIRYSHIRSMGCPKPIRDRYKQDNDWDVYTRDFLDYLEGQEDSIIDVAECAQELSTCLVCFEADFNRCHRSFVARAAAKSAGLSVVHLTNQKEILDSMHQSAA